MEKADNQWKRQISSLKDRLEDINRLKKTHSHAAQGFYSVERKSSLVQRNVGSSRLLNLNVGSIDSGLNTVKSTLKHNNYPQKSQIQSSAALKATTLQSQY